MVKVAVFTRTFPNLSQTFVTDHVIGLLQRGHEVTVCAQPPSPGAPVDRRVVELGLADRVHHWSGAREALAVGSGWWAAPSVGWRMLAHRPRETILSGPARMVGALRARALPRFDVILCHFGNQGLLAHWLRELGVLSGRLAVVFHGFDMSAYLDRHPPDVYAPLFRDGDLMLPISERWKRKLIDLGCPPHKIEVLHMGIDVGRFDWAPRARFPGDRLELLSVGRCVDKKGFDIGLEAVARVEARLPDFRYRIVGDGPNRSALERQSVQLGLQSRVEFLGARPPHEVLAFMQQAHVLVAPSATAPSGDMEGIPVVLMEAMAQGLLVLSTFHSGIPELVPKELLVPERDPGALATRLVDLCAMLEDERAAAWSRRLRARVESEFASEPLHDRLATLLQQVVGTSS
jgi:colanic acid/amylovoran biosynthesis glycosyltransferase